MVNVHRPISIILKTSTTHSICAPDSVTNSGSVLHWAAVGDGITNVSYDSNIPTFDFSSNDGSEIVITITSSDDLQGVTVMDLYGGAGNMNIFTAVDFTGALNIETIYGYGYRLL